MKTRSWEKHKKELLEDKAFRKELEKIEPEFDFARQVIKYRIQMKMSQTELAEKAHTRQPVISKIESGMANPSLETIEKISKALSKKVSLRLT